MRIYSKPYADHILLAKRWDKAVDFASPMTAWSSAMFKEYNNAMKENRPPSMANCEKPGN